MSNPDKTATLVVDYVAICERRGEVLDLGEFRDHWTVAEELTERFFPDMEAAERELERLYARKDGSPQQFAATRR